jgi:hypothetical protein
MLAARVLRRIKKFTQKNVPPSKQVKSSETRSPENMGKINTNSLLFYFGNIHSQRGQDGIIAEIFRRLEIHKGLFVEFGAWDGIYLSNCRYLFEKGWGGVFIEMDSTRFVELKHNYIDYPYITLINAAVGAAPYGVAGENLKALLSAHFVNVEEIAFVSIDVDGPDMEIFLDMGFSPPVVIVEGGFSLSPSYKDKLPKEIAWNNIQQPLPVIIDAGRKRGYTAVCFYQDTYFIRNDLMHNFPGLSGDAIQLYSDAFHFMPHEFNEWLMNARSENKNISEPETQYFGHFSRNPLGYIKPST